MSSAPLVKNKWNQKIVRPVYGSKESADGEIMLLTFDYETWFWIDAKSYVPVDFALTEDE